MIRVKQKSTFQREIHNLENGKGQPPRRKILPFHPFLDEGGLLCAQWVASGGGNAFGERHPVLFPGSHRITRLLTTAGRLL